MDWSQCSAVDRLPGKMGGVWCFAETRISVESLFENLAMGATVDEFLEWFPDLKPELVHAVLEFARASLREPVKAA